MSCSMCGKDHDYSYHVPGMSGQGGATKPTPSGVNRAIHCPHCNTSGYVRVKVERRKVGVSGGKATGAILTGGISLLATGLSRKQRVSVMTCGHCRMSWTVAG